MAGGVNKAIIIGNLGKDPEIRFTKAGTAVCNFTVATNDVWTDKAGNKQERVEWHRIVAWGKLGEHCGEYLAKGRQCFVEGRIQTRDWTDKEGKKNYTTEIVAQNVQFLGSGGGRAAAKNGEAAEQDFGPPPPGMEEPATLPPPQQAEDDIPF